MSHTAGCTGECGYCHTLRSRKLEVVPRCACGTRLRLNAATDRCAKCQRARKRVWKALGRVGFEIVPVRIISGGGGPGTGKDRR